jgi:predicted  nucleic acid-binding Zn-ribbon protein
MERIRDEDQIEDCNPRPFTFTNTALFMQLFKPTGVAATPKSVLALSGVLLLIAVIVGAVNTYKVKALRTGVAEATAVRDATERHRLTEQNEIKARETAVAAATAKIAETEAKASKAETELAQLQKEKADWQTKLQANETEIVSLQKRIEEAGAKSETNPGAASSGELQAQLDEARRLLDAAEREKAFLSDKLGSVQTRSVQVEEETKRREPASGRLGVRGTVLAVNQAYNFVVLNLGGRQGVEPNSEMLVLRSGTLIGKIRISSVEPSTAIGDIVTSSLARGVQVQPGDIVIYAGSNS